jgi:hypothetical protein
MQTVWVHLGQPALPLFGQLLASVKVKWTLREAVVLAPHCELFIESLGIWGAVGLPGGLKGHTGALARGNVALK